MEQIANFNIARRDLATLQNLFHPEAYFAIEVNFDATPFQDSMNGRAWHMNAYFGLTPAQNLNLLLIAQRDDSAFGANQEPTPYVYQAGYFNLPKDILPTQDAYKDLERWNKHTSKWIDDMYQDRTDGFPRANKVPLADLVDVLA